MPGISLCLIVNNAEEYIRRCLNSFRPIADEICVVRAVGCLAPDRTLEIAEQEFGARVAEYHNRPGREDWPHVDDFAAARQLSFDLATRDWCFWCDSDDILKAGAEQIRRHANNGEFACYVFPYDIFGKNVVVRRERMMLKNSGQWQFPVHECFKFKIEPVTAGLDEGVIVQHLPRLDKGQREIAAGGMSGNQRNLRILESLSPEALTSGLKYHLFGELMCAGRRGEAVDLAVNLLTEKELGKDERYDLLMSLVLQTPDLLRQVDLLHEAHKVDPERREALGVLSCVMMDLNRPVSALAYARQMAATLSPDIHSWNSRQNFYGYTGDDIYQQALRVNGRFDEANKVRRESIRRHGGPRIALLHASRGRPEKASRCRKAWHDLAAKPGQLEHIFAIDEDDEESKLLKRFHHVTLSPGGGSVRAWNVAAQATEAPVIVQLSDDWIPVPQWDDLILERIGDVGAAKVLAISDNLRTDGLLCMAICTRTYLCADYFLFHPWFIGVYSDNWFTEKAYERGVVIEARDIVFTHNHPVKGLAQMDATYTAQNSPERYAQGEKILQQLRAGTDWTSVPGWFNFWPFYEMMAERLNAGDSAVEVGVWMGRSIIYLAQQLQRLGKTGVKLIAVDTFKGELNQPAHEAIVRQNGGSLRKVFEANLKRCGVADLIEIVEGDSAESAAQIAGGLSFCFIDAAHDYQSVQRDLAAWRPKMKPGSIFAGHDIQWPDVQRAVKESGLDAKICGPVWFSQV